MKSTSFKVEEVFVDLVSKDSFSREQTTKPNKVLAKIM